MSLTAFLSRYTAPVAAVVREFNSTAGHWVTAGGDEDGDGGGVHLFISGSGGSKGIVTKGPKSLIGASLNNLSNGPHSIKHHPVDHTPPGAKEHPSYAEHKPTPTALVTKPEGQQEGVKNPGKPYARLHGADQGKGTAGSEKSAGGASEAHSAQEGPEPLTKEQAEAGLAKARAESTAKSAPKEDDGEAILSHPDVDHAAVDHHAAQLGFPKRTQALRDALSDGSPIKHKGKPVNDATRAAIGHVVKASDKEHVELAEGYKRAKESEAQEADDKRKAAVAAHEDKMHQQRTAAASMTPEDQALQKAKTNAHIARNHHFDDVLKENPAHARTYKSMVNVGIRGDKRTPHQAAVEGWIHNEANKRLTPEQRRISGRDEPKDLPRPADQDSSATPLAKEHLQAKMQSDQRLTPDETAFVRNGYRAPQSAASDDKPKANEPLTKAAIQAKVMAREKLTDAEKAFVLGGYKAPTPSPTTPKTEAPVGAKADAPKAPEKATAEPKADNEGGVDNDYINRHLERHGDKSPAEKRWLAGNFEGQGSPEHAAAGLGGAPMHNQATRSKLAEILRGQADRADARAKDAPTAAEKPQDAPKAEAKGDNPKDDFAAKTRAAMAATAAHGPTDYAARDAGRAATHKPAYAAPQAAGQGTEDALAKDGGKGRIVKDKAGSYTLVDHPAAVAALKREGVPLDEATEHAALQYDPASKRISAVRAIKKSTLTDYHANHGLEEVSHGKAPKAFREAIAAAKFETPDEQDNRQATESASEIAAQRATVKDLHTRGLSQVFDKYGADARHKQAHDVLTAMEKNHASYHSRVALPAESDDEYRRSPSSVRSEREEAVKATAKAEDERVNGPKREAERQRTRAAMAEHEAKRAKPLRTDRPEGLQAREDWNKPLSNGLSDSQIGQMDHDERATLLADKKLPFDVVHEIAGYGRDSGAAAAKHPNASAETLHGLATEPNGYHEKAYPTIARHPNAAPETLDHIARSGDAKAMGAVAANPNAHADTRRFLREEQMAYHPEVRAGFAKNPQTTGEELRQLDTASGSKDMPDFHKALASHPHLEEGHMVSMAHYGNHAQREALAKRADVPESVQDAIIHKPDGRLSLANDATLKALIANPKTSGRLIYELARSHPNREVADAAQARMDKRPVREAFTLTPCVGGYSAPVAAR